MRNKALVSGIFNIPETMTSWIRVAPRRPVQNTSMLFETTDGGLCGNFNQFLYAYEYSLKEGKPLQVYDLANPVSVAYPLLKNTFVDVSGVTYIDGMIPSASSTRRVIDRVMANAQATPIATLRKHAQQMFQWNPNFIPVLQNILSAVKLPETFDLGVHIRLSKTSDRKTLVVDDYIKAAKAAQGSKASFTIFLMSDSSTAISEFKKKAPSSWKIYTLPATIPNAEGYVQAQFNSAIARIRLTAYQTFMAELLVMQSISNIVTSFSNNVGRFLYYTVEYPENIISLDGSFAIL